MNIGGGQIRGAPFNLFVMKKSPFYIFRMLSSISNITTCPGHTKIRKCITYDLPVYIHNIHQNPQLYTKCHVRNTTVKIYLP